MGLVTNILSKTDAEYHSDGAKEAVNKEINKLITAGVWDTTPLAKSNAERLFPDATFSRIFGILGIKDVESTTAKYKYRVVLQGSNVRNITKKKVNF